MTDEQKLRLRWAGEHTTKLAQIWGNRFRLPYPRLYVNVHTDVPHWCRKCRQISPMNPDSLRRGKNGCPNCKQSGFNFDTPAIVYLASVRLPNNRNVFKVGITNGTFEKRYCFEDRGKMRLIEEVSFTTGREAHSFEQALLKKYALWRFRGVSPLKGARTRELFRTRIRLEISLKKFWSQATRE